MRTPPSDLGEPSRRPGRIGVGVVSAGRVGAVLGSALRAAGHTVVGVNAVSRKSRERAAVMLPGVPVLDIREIVRRADLVLVSVPDDVAPEVVAGLAELGAWQTGQLVAHTSRFHGLELLDPAVRRGAIPLVISPVMAFSGLSLDVARLSGCAVAVTAPEPVLPIAEALVVEMGGEPVIVGEEARAVFHAAIAHGSDHLVTLVGQVEELLARAGILCPERVAGPLLRTVVEDALDRGDCALSGPLTRGHRDAVEQHRRVLAADAARSGSAHILASYLTLARSAAERAVDAGQLSMDQAENLLGVLAE